MSINRSLFLTILLLSINNQSTAMLRPTTQHALTSAPVSFSSHTHLVIRQQIFKNRRYLLEEIATKNALYGTHYLVTEREKIVSEKEKKELATYYLRDKAKFDQFIKTITIFKINPHDFVAENGKTPLRAACEFGDIDAIKMLIERGEISIGTKELLAAIFYNKVNVMNFLLEHPNLKPDTDENDVPLNFSFNKTNDCIQLYEKYRKKKYQEYIDKKTKKQKQ